ncbi:hypothetical protein D3C73_1305720 [compost metagenome]
MAIAIDSQGLAGQDLDLEIVFTGLWREVDDLAGETAVRFREGCDVFEFCPVDDAGQRDGNQPDGGTDGR